METCKGKVCPTLSAAGGLVVCIEHQCAHYQQLIGRHPQTGEPLAEFDCAIRWQNVLLIETSGQVRQYAAATESMRNEARKDSAAIGNSILAVAEAVGKAAAQQRSAELEIPARRVERLPLLARLRLAFRGE
jgi:hypothetical protein